MEKRFNVAEWDQKLGEVANDAAEIFRHTDAIRDDFPFAEGHVRAFLGSDRDDMELSKLREIVESLHEDCESGIRTPPEGFQFTVAHSNTTEVPQTKAVHERIPPRTWKADEAVRNIKNRSNFISRLFSGFKSHGLGWLAGAGALFVGARHIPAKKS